MQVSHLKAGDVSQLAHVSEAARRNDRCACEL